MGKELSDKFYDEVYKIGGSEEIYFKDFSQTPWVNVWSAIIKEIKKNNFKKVFDIGCGPGQFAEFLNKKINKINYFGLDFSIVAVNFAKLKVPSFEFVCENALTFDYNLVDYDVVVITEFLEHIEGDLLVLQKLRSGTMVLATLPNMDSEGHVRFLSKDTNKAKNEIFERYQDICDIIEIKHFPYELNPDNGDHLIKMIIK